MSMVEGLNERIAVDVLGFLLVCLAAFVFGTAAQTGSFGYLVAGFLLGVIGFRLIGSPWFGDAQSIPSQ